MELKRKRNFTILATIGLIIVVLLGANYIPSLSATSSMTLHTSGKNVYDANGNQVVLRGVGMAGFLPNLIFWGNGQSDGWDRQWDYTPVPEMDATFQVMRDTYHINYIRVFVYPSWWYRENIIPNVEAPSSQSSTTPVNIKTYTQTLCQEAAKYGIYVNIVPYTLVPWTGSYDGDPYASPSMSWQGLPGMDWEAEPKAFLNDIGYGNNEMAFWNWFWSDVAVTLQDHPNVIYEAWNEPGWLGGDLEPIPAGYMTYLQTMYNSIRNVNSQAIIEYQWHMGWVPNGWNADLSWCAEIQNSFNPSNIIYTTHYYYVAGWGTDNSQKTHGSWGWATDYDTLKTQVLSSYNSMGVNAPLVINEEGSCLVASDVLGLSRQDSYTWFTNLLRVQSDLGIGNGAYYWIGDKLSSAYAGETLLTTGYTPNQMGSALITSYNTPTNPTEVPTQTVSPTNQPTLTPLPVNDLISNNNFLFDCLLVGLIMFVLIVVISIKRRRD